MVVVAKRSCNVNDKLNISDIPASLDYLGQRLAETPWTVKGLVVERMGMQFASAVCMVGTIPLLMKSFELSRGLIITLSSSLSPLPDLQP